MKRKKATQLEPKVIVEADAQKISGLRYIPDYISLDE